jgi:hypothetical protein
MEMVLNVFFDGQEGKTTNNNVHVYGTNTFPLIDVDGQT